MEIYDVGFSSMFVMEARSLAALAEALGNRSAERATLLQRADAMEALIRKHLWDHDRGIFANRFLRNGSLSAKIGPTSFYPLQAGVATVPQAEAMVKGWLSNRSRFCVSEDWERENDPDACYWGLPSITADDESFMRASRAAPGAVRRRRVGADAGVAHLGRPLRRRPAPAPPPKAAAPSPRARAARRRG